MISTQAGWTATRERSMRQDGTSNGFLYQFTDPDGEAFISLSAAARGALRRLSKSDSESEEEEEAGSIERRCLAQAMPMVQWLREADEDSDDDDDDDDDDE